MARWAVLGGDYDARAAVLDAYVLVLKRLFFFYFYFFFFFLFLFSFFLILGL